MRLKCPGCGTWLCDDEELNDDGDEVPIEMEHIAGGRWAVTEIVHTPARCRTASGVAALVDAARGAEPWLAHFVAGEPKPGLVSSDDPDQALTALRAALGALR